MVYVAFLLAITSVVARGNRDDVAFRTAFRVAPTTRNWEILKKIASVF